MEIVLAPDPARDAAELSRLGAPVLTDEYLHGDWAMRYRAAGLEIERALRAGREALAAIPSTWARRLALGGGIRSVVALSARALGPAAGEGA